MIQSQSPAFKFTPPSNLLFWQPKVDFYFLATRLPMGKALIVVLNYSIWIFMAYWSVLLIRYDLNFFWRLLVVTALAEVIEKIGKSMRLWPRPFYFHHRNTPKGLIDRWYKTGSLPSGHTIKATYFLLFLIQSQVFSPLVFLIVAVPLIAYRILIGFHYPIDVIVGILLGLILWLVFHNLYLPQLLIPPVSFVSNWFFSLIQ